ncbi:MAG: HAMP domain-containing histidine kinase [Chloroflexota bacterium]|nr:MAG: HAMP domain-containing histidine kinase [Chloroflexota bacterium]
MYAAHTRGHYDDLDAALVPSTWHAIEEYDRGRGAPAGSLMVTGPAPVVRIHGPDDAIESESRDAAMAPVIAPGSISSRPAVPDPIAVYAPPFVEVDLRGGVLGVVETAERRWRAYVAPMANGRRLVALAPLDHLDASITEFRKLVVGLVAAATVVTLLAGWMLAQRALRPVAILTATARHIAVARGFDQRVPIGAENDELGRLAVTFNEMLASLEHAYRAEQRFVGDASHELRAPLTAIQANLELLERYPRMPANERADAIAEASREAQRLSRLVADLLALARADAGVTVRKVPVELERVAREAASDARHLARGHALAVGDTQAITVLGDSDRLKQLIVILLDNAFKYTPSDGRVALSVRREGGDATITVMDTGVGIAAADLPHVFDRFYRADPARGRDAGGTGLGLPIARWIAEQHDGTISLDSAPGRGTKATVRIPIQ